MRSGHRPNPMLIASVLAAFAGPAFLGVARAGRRGEIQPTEHVPPAFDPLALFDGRRRPRSRRGKRAGEGAFCGARQTARYARQGNAEWNINRHYVNRMDFNERHAVMLAARDAKMREAGRFAR